MPVLLIHGEADAETRVEHSRRIEAALAGPKRLVVVRGAGHDDTLRGEAVWTEIEGWLAALDLGRAPVGTEGVRRRMPRKVPRGTTSPSAHGHRRGRDRDRVAFPLRSLARCDMLNEEVIVLDIVTPVREDFLTESGQ